MTQNVTCDGCGQDITSTGNSIDYRLKLSTETPAYPSHGGVTDMMIYPAIKRTLHFCNNLECLRAWMEGPVSVAHRTEMIAEREAAYRRRNER